MPKKEMERLPRPEPNSPVDNPSAGKITVVVSGRLKVTSGDQRVEVIRKEQ